MNIKKSEGLLNDKFEKFLDELLMEHLKKINEISEIKKLIISRDNLIEKEEDLLLNSVSAKVFDELENVKEELTDIESQISLEEVSFIYKMGIKDGIILSQKYNQITS